MGRHSNQHTPWNSHPKRRHAEPPDQQDDDWVDDLAIVARYAVVPPSSPYYPGQPHPASSTRLTSSLSSALVVAAAATAVQTTAEDPTPSQYHKENALEDDADKIDLDDDEDELEESPAPWKHENSANGIDPAVDDAVARSTSSSTTSSSTGSPEPPVVDDDDDDDDVDLKEQLARMVAAGGDDDDDGLDDNDEKRQATKGNKPMTVHEIDPYAADLNELQKEFQWNVAVQEEDEEQPRNNNNNHVCSDTTSTTTSTSLQQQQWGLAGTIQHHMVPSRTITVLSLGGSQILPEGTWLAVRASTDDDSSSIVRLGRILEVFGPVSQPLYSVRLPDPPVTKTTTTTSPTAKTRTKKQPNEMVEHAVDDDKQQQSAQLDPSTASNTEPPYKVKATEMAAVLTKESKETAAPVAENANTATTQRSFLNDSAVAETKRAAIRESTTGLEESTLAVEKNKMEETNLPVSSSSTVELIEDHWSADGRYTQLLKHSSRVYFAQPNPNARVFLDTQAIYRQSGRGCDASNLYDEEAHETEFSDDEQERIAKGHKKAKGRGGGGRGAAKERLHPPPARGPPPGGVPSFHTPTPLGFHPGWASRQQYSHTAPPNLYSHPQQRESGAYYHGNLNNNTTPYYSGPHQYQGQTYASNPSGYPPPPPPPRHGYSQYPPQQPQPLQQQQQQQESESDTVYYDFT